MPIFLKHVEGSKTDQLESFEKDQIRIGRQSDNDVKFDPQKDLSVSGYHAEIYRDGEVFFLKDLQSRNGTFVNSRKIDRPVSLKDGDIIQFSSRGPKVVFSTQDPSQASATAVMEPDAATRTVVSAAEEKPTPERDSGFWEKIKPIFPVIAAALGVPLYLSIGWFLGYSWWALLISAAVTLLVTGGAYLGWRFWKRRRALREQKQTDHEQREASLGRGDRDNIQDLRRKWAEVVRSLRDSNLKRSGDDAIYALPWYVQLGESGGGKSAFIRAGGPINSIRSQGQDGPTNNCDWWFFDKTVLLDTSGRYAFQAKDSESAAEWRELLNLLRNQRRREPINGVIVTVAADALVSRPVDKLKEQAAQIRERLDEMVHQLGVKFPIYLAISKCDLIVGFKDFFEALPEEAKGQALGYVNSDAANSTDGSRFFDKAFRVLCERAERVRLSVLLEEERNEAAHGMFLFPAELTSLQPPLKAFVDVLFRPSPYRDAPFFRGLFLASARQTGSPVSRISRSWGLHYAHRGAAETSREVFLRDFFSVILPNDRALVSRTALGRERYQLARAAGWIFAIAMSLLLCGLFTLSFTNNWLALKRLDISPCKKAEGATGTVTQRLGPLSDCRETIESLIPRSLWKKMALNFGLEHTHDVVSALQKRFLAAFGSGVLKPLDDRIDQSLSAGSRAPVLVAAILQRIDLLTHCQEEHGCPDPAKWVGPNYRAFLVVESPEIKDSDPAVGRLAKAHQSYLLWQPNPKIFAEMQANDVERVRRWYASDGLREELIVASATEQFPPIKISDFWGVSSPGQVDAAYTAKAWQEAIQPLIAGLKKMPVEGRDLGKQVAEFEHRYKKQALQRWGEFLAKFAESEPRGRVTSRDLALSLLGSKSPYPAVMVKANDNLSGILGTAWQESDLPPWAVMLKRYMALKAKLEQAQKGGKQAAEEKGQGKEAEALNYINIYVEALRQLPSKLTTPQDSFLTAQNAFREGEPNSKPGQPILQAFWAVRMLRGSELFQDRDPTFWTLLERPVDLTWKAMLDGAGEYLQLQWRQVLFDVTDLDPGPKASKVMGFLNGPAAGFVKPQVSGYGPNTLLGRSVPFTPDFIRFISYLSSLRPDALQTNPAQLPVVMKLPQQIVRTS